ncbi:hypothetical protein SAMN05428979_0626 [Stappia sp. ES.058]|nr:hypothetical protein SAMN05428979_0626 [Stappia sp. ES.058]
MEAGVSANFQPVKGKLAQSICNIHRQSIAVHRRHRRATSSARSPPILAADPHHDGRPKNTARLRLSARASRTRPPPAAPVSERLHHRADSGTCCHCHLCARHRGTVPTPGRTPAGRRVAGRQAIRPPDVGPDRQPDRRNGTFKHHDHSRRKHRRPRQQASRHRDRRRADRRSGPIALQGGASGKGTNVGPHTIPTARNARGAACSGPARQSAQTQGRSSPAVFEDVSSLHDGRRREPTVRGARQGTATGFGAPKR